MPSWVRPSSPRQLLFAFPGHLGSWQRGPGHSPCWPQQPGMKVEGLPPSLRDPIEQRIGLSLLGCGGRRDCGGDLPAELQNWAKIIQRPGGLPTFASLQQNENPSPPSTPASPCGVSNPVADTFAAPQHPRSISSGSRGRPGARNGAEARGANPAPAPLGDDAPAPAARSPPR